MKIELPEMSRRSWFANPRIQALKILEEVLEVMETDDPMEMAEETVDVIQAAMTLLQMLEETEGIPIGAITAKVAAKNERRGYYE